MVGGRLSNAAPELAIRDLAPTIGQIVSVWK
jgi:hypothetical protein